MSDLVRYYGESHACHPAQRGFNRRIQREDVDLERISSITLMMQETLSLELVIGLMDAVMRSHRADPKLISIPNDGCQCHRPVRSRRSRCAMELISSHEAEVSSSDAACSLRCLRDREPRRLLHPTPKRSAPPPRSTPWLPG